MSVFSQRMTELRRLLKLHSNWLVYATLGESALTKSELSDLKEYGKLPMKPLDLVDNSYFLGRMSATRKSSEYKKVAKVVTALLKETEEIALEAVKHKTIQRLKSVASNVLELKNKQAWRSAVRTEFQSAKIQGIANTIANKSDIYANSAGANSNVSVIPAKECCEDCRFHYADVDGNPKIFKLSDLMEAGSNSDVGTVHTKVDGRHTHWRTTLPPMHPRCGCKLVYIPPGHGWESGKLSLLNKSLFIEHIAKARPGVRGPGLSATVAPTGAPSVAKEPGHPSVPGAAAPGNLPGPGRPPGSGGAATTPDPGGGGIGSAATLVACPWDKCDSGGQHHSNSKTYQEHAQRAAATGEFTPKAKQDNEKHFEQQSKIFNAQNHSSDKILNHLTTGKIGSSKNLSSIGLAGAHSNSAFKVNFVDGPSGAMKPPPKFSSGSRDLGMIDGANSIPDNSGHISEAGAYKLSSALGLTDHIPPTALRTSDGSNNIPAGEYSVQHWQDDYKSFDLSDISSDDDAYKSLVADSPDPEKTHKKLSEIAVLDIVMNNNDRHFGNLMQKSDKSDVVAIDHGLSFGSGLQGHKNQIHVVMNKSDVPLVVPDHLMERFNNSTLSDVERSLESSGLKDWQVMQTYLRMKYVAHLQDSYGYIPLEATRGVKAGNDGELYSGLGFSGDFANRQQKVKSLNESQGLPDQLFSSFAKQHITDGLTDKDSPEFSSFQKMADAMPLHPPGQAWDENRISSDVRKEHWNNIGPFQGNRVLASYESRWGKPRPDSPQRSRTPPEPSEPSREQVLAERARKRQEAREQAEREQSERERKYAAGEVESPEAYMARRQQELGKVKKSFLYLNFSSKFPLDKFDL